MKFTSGDVPDNVPKDGMCAIIDSNKKLDIKSRSEKLLLTDRNGVVEIPDVNDNQPTMNGTSHKLADANGCSKEPVENAASDSEDNSSNVKEPEESDDLSETLSKCHISEKSVGRKDEGDELIGKISNLRINNETDKETVPKDEEQYIEIKSSDIITPDEIDRKKKDLEGKKITERGPTGGIPTNYVPNQPRYNQTAMKSYPVNVSCPMFDQMNTGYGYNQQPMYNNFMCQQRPDIDLYQQTYQNVPKRGRDDYDEPPIKFNRPVETKFNNLSDPPKTQMPSMTYSNVVSKKALCGVQVAVKSPDIEPLMPCYGAITTSGEFDVMSFLKDDTYTMECGLGTNPLDAPKDQVNQLYHPANSVLSNHDTYLDQTHLNLSGMDQTRRQNGPENRSSFSTDTDGGSEGYISDVASPYSEQQDSPPAGEHGMYSPPPSNSSIDSGMCMSTVPSPGSQMDTCSPRSTMTGYESNIDIYDPTSPFNPLSPGNVTQNISTLSQNSQMVRPAQQGNQPGVNMPQMDYPVTTNVTPVNQVYACSQSGNVQNTRAEDSTRSEYIDNHLPFLKDVFEVLADDLSESGNKKIKNSSVCASQSLPKPPNLPQQRPLPSSQPSHMKPVASVPPSQGSNILPSAPVTSAPVLLVQQPNKNGLVTSGQPKGGPQASVTTSQILVIPAAPQPAPTFVIVTPQPLQPTKKPTQYRPIQPKIQPNPAPGKGSPADSKNPVTNSSMKGVSSSKPVQSVNSMPPVAQVQPTQCQKVPNPAPKNSGNQLNIARRLVADMTTDDLKFTDRDGDTFLHVAVCKADKYMVQALLERIVRENLQHMIDTQNSERQTPVYLAVSANQPEMVDLFNKHGADVNLLAERIAPNGQKEVKAAIHSASSNGKEYLQTLKSLLRSPELNLNMFNSDGYTALHCAILEHNQPRHDTSSIPNGKPVYTDSKPIIEALIKAGADPNAQDKKSGKTAFMYALESSDNSLVETLLSLVDITKVRSYFRTQAFDGSTCVKIMESRKCDFPNTLYERLTGILSSKCYKSAVVY